MSIFNRKGNIEFVESSIEEKEIRGFTFKGLLDGSWLTNMGVMEHLPYILFLVTLAGVYITNRYNAEKVVREISQLRTEVKDKRAEQLTTASELMDLSKPSRIEQLSIEKGLMLKTPEKPPYIIEAKKEQ